MSYIITDNAATMKCAFLVQMPQQLLDPFSEETDMRGAGESVMV